MIVGTNVMIFAFPVKWGVMFLKFNVMFFLRRIILPRLEFNLGCGAIFVIYEKAYTKMAPQGATAKHFRNQNWYSCIDNLTVPFIHTRARILKMSGLSKIFNCSNSIITR